MLLGLLVLDGVGLRFIGRVGGLVVVVAIVVRTGGIISVAVRRAERSRLGGRAERCGLRRPEGRETSAAERAETTRFPTTAKATAATQPTKSCACAAAESASEAARAARSQAAERRSTPV
jgi:hypothetical protein